MARKGLDPEKQLILVCDRCLCASCWQGVVLCDEARHAGITYRTVAELRKLKREHPKFWNVDEGPGDAA